MSCAIDRAAKRWDDAVDRIFERAGEKIRGADEAVTQRVSGGRLERLLTVSQTQKEIGVMLSEYRVARAQIDEAAADIKRFLETLDVDRSHALVQALSGDLDPKTLDVGTRKLYDRFRRQIDANAQALVDAEALNAKYKITDYVKRYYTQYIDDIKGSHHVYFDRRFKSRKKLTHDERIAMGMIEDADFVVSNTVAAQRAQMLKAKTLKAIADRFAFKGPDEEVPPTYVRIPDHTSATGVYTYGKLAGKYVPKEVAEALDAAKVTKEAMSEIENGWYRIVDHLKVNLTIKNPPTHAYNIGSNLLLASLNGHVTALAKVLKMAARDKEKFQALVTRANEFGLNSFLNDVGRVEFEMSSRRGAGVARSILKNIYMTADSKMGRGVRHLYDWEDKIFKLAAWVDEMETAQKRKGSPLSEEEQKQAFYRASEMYVDYNTPLPGAVRILDKSGVSPFLHYVYKSTPAVAKSIAKHPLRFMTIQALAVAGGASALLNDDDDAYKPHWGGDENMLGLKGRNMFGVKEWTDLGNGWHLNAGRLMPGVKFGTIDTTGGFIGGIVRIFGGESPLGYRIDSEYDPVVEKVRKRFGTALENYMPPMTFGRYGQRIAKHAAGVEQKNYYDEDMTSQEILLRALGVRRFNESKEVSSKMNKAANRYKELSKDADPAARRRLWEEFRSEVKRLRDAARKKRLRVSAPGSGGGGFGIDTSVGGLVDLGL